MLQVTINITYTLNIDNTIMKTSDRRYATTQSLEFFDNRIQRNYANDKHYKSNRNITTDFVIFIINMGELMERKWIDLGGILISEPFEMFIFH